MWRFSAHLAHVATPMQCISLYESLLHVLQTQSTQICRSQEASSVAVSQIQKLIPKGRGSERRQIDDSPELRSSCHKLCVVMVVSDGLRSTLIWSNFPLGSKPPDPLTMLHALHAHTTLHCARHTNSQFMYICPPFSNLWICP